MPGKNAADLMIEDINAKGGIGGVPVKATYVEMEADYVVFWMSAKSNPQQLLQVSDGDEQPEQERPNEFYLAGNVEIRQTNMKPRVGPDGRSRYLMLETLRGYGLDRLSEAGEVEQAKTSMAGYAGGVVEQASAGMQAASGASGSPESAPGAVETALSQNVH